MTFTTNNLDQKMCDINVNYRNNMTLREWLHFMFNKVFGLTTINDEKLNQMSEQELTKLIYDFLYLTEHRNIKE